MNDTLKVVLGGVLLAILLVLGVSFPKTDLVNGPKGDQGLQGPAGARGPVGLTGPQGSRGLQGPAGQSGQLGTSPGPNRYLPFDGVNGVRRYFSSMAFNQATDTPCVLVGPSATSTLVSNINQINEATSVPMEIEIAKAAAKSHATTTRLGSLYNMAAFSNEVNLGESTIVGSTTPGAVFFPNQNLVVKWAFRNTDDRIDSLDGVCNAIWEVL